MNLLQLIASRQQVAGRAPQEFVMGVVIGYSAQRYQVNANGLTYDAESMVSDRLLAGDRVFLALGKGTPRIIGLQGKDETSL